MELQRSYGKMTSNEHRRTGVRAGCVPQRALTVTPPVPEWPGSPIPSNGLTKLALLPPQLEGPFRKRLTFVFLGCPAGSLVADT